MDDISHVVKQIHLVFLRIFSTASYSIPVGGRPLEQLCLLFIRYCSSVLFVENPREKEKIAGGYSLSHI